MPVDSKSLGRKGGRKAASRPQHDPRDRDTGEKKPLFASRHVSIAALTQFTSQFATLQNAGLPVVRSLRILSGQMRPGHLKTTVARVYEDVEGGSSLSEAMRKHSSIFDNLYVSMVKAGEAGGVLDVILDRLSGFKEKDLKLQKQLKSASIYPAFVLFVAMGVLFLVMTMVVPKFKEFFAGMGEDLPPLTQIVLDVGEFAKAYWYVLIFIPGVIYGILKLIGRTEGGAYFFDRLRLKAPVLGVITKKTSVARFTRTLSTLLESGVPILESLSIVKASIGNLVLADAVEDVAISIREGEGMARPLGESGQFDDMLVNMVDVGEKTGELDRMLGRIAENYENDVDILVKSLSSLLEPMLIIVIGGVVFVVILSLFLPLVKLMDKLGTS